jgi:hypothetical protein
VEEHVNIAQEMAMKRKSLIGHTGFVGSNLDRQTKFICKYNSSNIESIRGEKFDLVVSAGTRAEMWLANQFPDRDKENIDCLISNLEKVDTNDIVLISTIEVYNSPHNVDEESTIDPEKLKPYGKNRFYLEQFVCENFHKHHIIRLPNLFGTGLKKNFLFDLMNRVPRIIISNKYLEILEHISKDERELLTNNYSVDGNGNYQICNGISQDILKRLRRVLEGVNFSSLVFTHKDSSFQYYNLDCLWADILKVIDADLRVVNFATEPVKASELARIAFNVDFDNITERIPFKYDFKTKFDAVFNGSDGYLYNKQDIIQQIRDFVASTKGNY